MAPVIHLANPRGFCAGVSRAISVVKAALEKFGAPVFVRHEVVHNRYVVENLRSLGAVFIEELSEVPDGSVLVYSAHGVPLSVEREAGSRDLKVFDATCPLVAKVHVEVRAHAKKNREVVMIGHKGHPEVDATIGQYESCGGGIYLIEKASDVASLNPQNPEELHYVTQTTLSVIECAGIVDALKCRFPNIQGPRKDDICYATQSRQDAVRRLASIVDMFVVVGSPNSSNSNRLRELAESSGRPAYLVDTETDIDESWFSGEIRHIGLTAGASAPSVVVNRVVSRIAEITGGEVVEEEGGELVERNFDIPLGLK